MYENGAKRSSVERRLRSSERWQGATDGAFSEVDRRHLIHPRSA